MAQKTPWTARWPSCEIVKLNTRRGTLPPGKRRPGRGRGPPVRAQAATCHLRSPVRSEWRPIRTIPTRATTKGMAVMRAQPEAAEARGLAQDLGQEEEDAVGGEGVQEVDRAQRARPCRSAAWRRPDAVARPARRARAPSRGSAIRGRRARAIGLLRSVGEVDEGHEAEHHRGESLDQEQPLPAVEAGEPVELQERFGNRAPRSSWRRAPPS